MSEPDKLLLSALLEVCNELTERIVILEDRIDCLERQVARIPNYRLDPQFMTF